MVADVRMKIALRLRAALADMSRELATDLTLRTQVTEARTRYETAEQVRATYRSRVVRNFPGCRVAFTPRNITIWLPDRYPNAQIPIVEQVDVGLMGCFNPKGYSNKPF